MKAKLLTLLSCLAFLSGPAIGISNFKGEIAYAPVYHHKQIKLACNETSTQICTNKRTTCANNDDCRCLDPSCNSGGSCYSHGLCCQIFGNIGAVEFRPL